MVDILLNILSFGLKPLYEKHLRFHKIINDFRNKLSRPQNRAKELTKEEKQNSILTQGSFLEKVTVLDLKSHKISLSETDIDQFYNQLENFDYSFILFKNYYKDYVENLKRFNPSAQNKDFDLVMVQLVLNEDKLKPTKPLKVLTHHLKYKYKLSSRIYNKLKK